GTGLGLPVAFGIMNGHGGYLTLDSRSGEGTTARLFLPRLIGATPASRMRPRETGEVLEPEQTVSRSILGVDEEQAVLDVVRRFRVIAGHEVRCVTTGTEALDVLSNGEQFDLVILDLMIPREDGSVTFQRIRQHWPRLPVLVCTALLQTDPGP